MERCIYCSNHFDARKGKGDHVIPAALGEFRNDSRFRRICSSCNNHIGESEQHVIRCGPEAFYRAIVRPQSSRLPKRRSSILVGAKGAPPPHFMVELHDHSETVVPELNDPRETYGVDQLVFKRDDGRTEFVTLNPRMRPAQLSQRIARLGPPSFNEIRLVCDTSNYMRYKELCTFVWPNCKWSQEADTEAVQMRVPTRVTFTLTEQYFQATAKIAFHYYLVHSQRGFRGDEKEFAPIREFIFAGGDLEQFVSHDGTRFELPFHEFAGYKGVPHHWCHILAADDTSTKVVAYVNLFVGPHSLGTPWYVTFARPNTRVLVPKSVRAHVFKITQRQGSSRFCGHVVEASIRRRR